MAKRRMLRVAWLLMLLVFAFWFCLGYTWSELGLLSGLKRVARIVEPKPNVEIYSVDCGKSVALVNVRNASNDALFVHRVTFETMAPFAVNVDAGDVGTLYSSDILVDLQPGDSLTEWTSRVSMANACLPPWESGRILVRIADGTGRHAGKMAYGRLTIHCAKFYSPYDANTELKYVTSPILIPIGGAGQPKDQPKKTPTRANIGQRLANR